MTTALTGFAALRSRSAGILIPGIFALSLFALPASAQVSRNVTLMANIDSYAAYANCCSYVHSDGREYAVIGTNTGTAIYNIVNPSLPTLVGFIPGVSSSWREMKQMGNYIYVVSEGTASGLQIIRMTNPQAPVLAATWNGFSSAHTITVDPARSLAYANGANGQTGGMRILSLANPEAPVQLASYTAHYVHDSHVRGNQLFVASIYEGFEIVLDVTNPASPTQVAIWTTPGNFTHNSWTSQSGNYLFTTDENSTGFVTVYDITGLPAVTEVARYTANPVAIAHNVHVKGDLAFVSHYTEGVRILDVSDPMTPTEVGYYDTWPGASGGFNGDWGVDPYYPSGTFIVSDISGGLFVFQADLDYGLMKGTVTAAGSGLPIEGARVEAPGTGISFTTFASGKFALALDAGSYNIEATRFGDYPASNSGPVASGQTTIRNIVMTPIPKGTVAGTITGGVGMTPLPGSELHLHETPLETSSTAGGAYSLGNVPEGPHLLEAARAGYLHAQQNVQVVGGSTTTANLNLTAMDFYYDVEAAAGWSLSAPGDNATAGLWILADPVGTGPQAPAIIGPLSLRDRVGPLHHPDGEGGAGPLTIQPEDDHTPAPGVNCFITGNGPVGGAVGVADVDNGITTLRSPVFDLSGVADPHISFYYWYTNDGGSNPGTDPFVISISANGGTTWTAVDSIYSSNHAWTYYDIRVLDYIATTNAVRMRFIAQDLGGGSIVEAGVDDFGYYAAPVQSAVPGDDRLPATRVTLLAGPNPFQVATDLRVSRPSAGPLSVGVFDVNGRRVRSLADGVAPAEWGLRWDGTNEEGRPVPAGIYFVRAAGDGFERTARLVRIR